MPEGDRVGSHAERRAPFFRDRLGQARHACFGEGVVCLPGVAVQAGGRGDVDDVSGLVVLDAEVGGGGADELEGLRVVQGQDGVPLFVGCLVLRDGVLGGWSFELDGEAISLRTNLVDDTVPGVAGVVDDDVDLSFAELGCFLD